MRTVGQLLQTKGHNVWSVSPEATILEALRVLDEKNVGALLVMEAGKLVGMLSERDYARRVILKGHPVETTRVSEIMTAQVTTIRPEQTVRDCMDLMTEKRIRHLPVVEGEQVTGIISIGDVVKEIISQQEFDIQNLENYITGRSR